MAEWIKYEQSLPKHHKVIAMAEWLGKQPKFIEWINTGSVTNDANNSVTVTRYVTLRPHVTISVVVVHLLEFWVLANSRGRISGNDLVLNYVGVHDCDLIGGMPLLGEAMQRVGFVIEEPMGQNCTQVRLPNYLERNTPAADLGRTANAQRQRRFREKKQAEARQAFGLNDKIDTVTRNGQSNVTVTDKRNGQITHSNALEERRGEENTQKTNTCSSDVQTNIPSNDNGVDWESGQKEDQTTIKSSKKKVTKIEDDGFDRFWKVWPKKIAKTQAVKSWSKLELDESLIETIVAAVVEHSKTEQWTKDSGQYIPLPATWLNNKRWEDELTVKIEQQQEKPKQNTLSDYDIAHGTYSAITGFTRNTHKCSDLSCKCHDENQ